MKKSTNLNPTTVTKSTNAKTLYVIFAVVVVGLIFLIGWFAYLLLWQPDDKDATSTNTNITNTSNVNKKNTNKNKNNALTNDSETNSNTENDNTNNTNDEGLVEPDENDNSNDNSNDNTNSDDEDSEAEGETKTLYFASSASSCGETVAVERPLTLGDDPYGEIILSMMSGPAEDEDGVDGIPSTVRLRQVQYTANGPLITVGEGYNDLSDCEKKTVDAQFIETANAMFDLPAGTNGEVVVGEVATDDTEDGTEEDTNSNTNTEE